MAAPATMAEFKGNVAAVLTENCWDMALVEAEERLREAAVKKVRDEGQYKNKPIAASRAADKYEEELRPKMHTPEQFKMYTVGISNASFHYNGSAYIVGKIGKAFAEAILTMEQSK